MGSATMGTFLGAAVRGMGGMGSIVGGGGGCGGGGGTRGRARREGAGAVASGGGPMSGGGGVRRREAGVRSGQRRTLLEGLRVRVKG